MASIQQTQFLLSLSSSKSPLPVCMPDHMPTVAGSALALAPIVFAGISLTRRSRQADCMEPTTSQSTRTPVLDKSVGNNGTGQLDLLIGWHREGSFADCWWPGLTKTQPLDLRCPSQSRMPLVLSVRSWHRYSLRRPVT